MTYNGALVVEAVLNHSYTQGTGHKGLYLPSSLLTLQHPTYSLVQLGSSQCRKEMEWVAKMAHWLRTLAAFPEDLSSVEYSYKPCLFTRGPCGKGSSPVTYSHSPTMRLCRGTRSLLGYSQVY